MQFPDDMPEEIRQQIEQHHMIVIAHGHEVHTFINELNENQLDTLRGILMNYWDRPTAAFLIGNIAAILVQKFGRCPVCGEKHDEALHQMMDDEKDLESDVPDEQLYTQFSGTKAEPMSDNKWATFTRLLPSEVLEDLHEYNMTLIPGVWPMIRCRGCGLEYVSLEDRKLRKKDECHGCQEKSKFG